MSVGQGRNGGFEHSDLRTESYGREQPGADPATTRDAADAPDEADRCHSNLQRQTIAVGV